MTTLTTPEALAAISQSIRIVRLNAGDEPAHYLDLARAHLAARVAELEGMVELVAGESNRLFDRANRAEAELAAVRAAIPSPIHERGDFERGYNAAVRNFDAAREGK